MPKKCLWNFGSLEKKDAKNKPAKGPIPIEEGGNLWRKMSNEKKHLVV